MAICIPVAKTTEACCGLPIFAANHVEGGGGEEVLRLAVEGAGVEEGCVVFNIGPGVLAQMQLGGRVPFNGAALLRDLAGGEESADLLEHGEAPEGFAGRDGWAVIRGEQQVLFDARGECVVENRRHSEIAVGGVARGDAVFHLGSGVAEAVFLGAGVVAEERGRIGSI